MGLFKKQQKPVGAVRKRPAQKPSKPLLHWQRLLPLMWGLIAAAVLTGLFKGGEVLLNQSVEKVAVTGGLKHVKKAVVVEAVTPFLTAGFIRLDMDGIRTELEKMPWVYEVRLQRAWPNNISINIVEQQAIAQWGNNGFLNHRGELFKPQAVTEIQGLPLLAGPDSSSKQVMNYYRSIAELLGRQGLALTGLSVDQRGAWQAELNGVVILKMGKEQVLEKVKRFARVYKQALPKDLVAVKTIDMRYSNGLAVGWHQPS